MKIRVMASRKRSSPKVGDTKLIRGVLHVRQWARATTGYERGALIVRNGRPVFEWVAA